MDQVRLPDLEVIKRFSIAVRREHADLEEVLDALQSDLAALRSAGGQARVRAEERPEPPPTRDTQIRARKAAVKPRRPAPARKAAKKKSSRGRR